MLVYLLKDIENLGMAGTLRKVSNGHARNCLIPRKMAVEVKPSEEAFFRAKSQKEHTNREEATTRLGMLAERIGNLHLTISKRSHDDGKLYGAVSADEVIEALKSKDVSVTRKQILFDRAVKSVGEHKIKIKLNAKLTPELTLKVSASSE